MLFVLSLVGYLLLAVIVLVLAAVLLVLFVPARFRTTGEFSFRPTDEGKGAVGEDVFWLELLARPEGRAPAQPQVELPDLEATLEARLTWFGGALAVDTGGIRLFGRRIGTARGTGAGRPAEEKSAPERRAEDDKHAEPVSPRRGRGRPGGSGRRQGGRGRKVDPGTVRRLIRPGLRALYRMWSALGLRLRLRITVGGDDPLTTALIAGRAAAVVYPIVRSVNARRPGSLDFALQPVFSEEVFAAAFDLSGRTTVFALVRPIAGFAWRPEVRKLWWPGRARRAGSSARRSINKEAA